MKICKIAIAVIFCLYLVLPSYSQETSLSQQAAKIKENYLKLKSPDIKERMRAVEYLSHVSTNEIGINMIDEFIDFFAEESARIKAAQKAENISFGTIPKTLFPDGEEFLTYKGNLCILAGKSGNLRALPLLIEYYAHPDAYVGFGEDAVQPFLEAMKKSDPSHEFLFYLVLKYWLSNKNEGYNASGATRKTIKDVLIEKALYNKDPDNRFSAVRALIVANDEDMVPVLREIAENDPGHYEEGKKEIIDKALPAGEKASRYPIRELAKAELEKRGKK
ncbi:MAG: hypothetical protein NTU60_02440 [Candidatus Aminicenantes bacterium]|nr:hypothetical protein [Candidatus Aminicenantes bacterium]